MMEDCMRFKLPITVKLSALIVSVVALTAFAINEVYLRGSNQILTDRAVSDLAQETEFFKYPLDNIVSELKDDVQLISRLQATLGLMRARLHNGIDPEDRSTRAQWEDRLATTFVEMLRTREHYRRIRFIGVADGGRDILRVERFGNQIERLSDAKLQRAADEVFFRDALSLAPGEVYLSEVNLSRDEGQLTSPYWLTLRAVVPIYTADNEVFGVIVINADFGAVLSDLRRNLQTAHTLYVANSAGDYLVHPDPSYLYASDLKHDHFIQRDHPNLLPVIANPKQDKAMFLPTGTGTGNVLAFQKYHYDALHPQRYLDIALEAPYSEIISKTAEVERQGFLFGFAIAAAAAIAAIFLLRLLIRPLNKVADAIVRYRKGEKEIALPVDSPDEIGVLAKEFQAMMKQKGDEDWVKENLVAIVKALLGFKDLQSFAQSLMTSATPAVNGQVGVLYVSTTYARNRAERDAEGLTLMAAFGYSQQGTLPRSFGWGEGLVGQCAKDRTPRLVSDVPADYLRIASGLGETKPKHILLQPILFENSLAGVMEIASVEGFTEIHRKFLEQLSFNAGVIINSISAGMRTDELLEETRMTAEELQRNEEELKTQQEELEASNEEMEEKSKALEEQNARIRQQSQDLTETTQLVEEKARQLELANKYKSEFLANMSHELRTPLNSLLILARSLAANEDGNLTPEQMEEARVIHNGGLELLSLINDILDLSKVEAGKLSIILEDAPLDGIVKRMREQFDPVAKEKRVAFNVKIADGLPSRLHTDSQRVEQILKNLLSNAFKFTSEGSVTIEVHRPDVRRELQRASLEHANAVAFTVIDTGIGIDASKLKDIFEAFQQEEGSIDRHYGGTGLGLTIARKFAHMLGGEIHVASKKGAGSVFTLILPTTLAGVEVEEPGTEERRPAQQLARTELKSVPSPAITEFIADDRKSIGDSDKVLLIIEDDENFAGTLMKVARRRGYKCLAAGDGRTGLLLAAEKRATAIILDLKLPDIDGITVLNQLKHDLRTRHIPVHIISGDDQARSGMPLHKGAIGQLTKPVEREAIDGVLSKIESLLQSGIKQVLVVEDDKKTQIAIHSLLKNKGILITPADRGVVALQKMQGVRFDCVILDLRLPDMTGLEFLEKMEEQAGDVPPPPVIIYTAKDLTPDEDRQLTRFTGSIIIKGASSPERLLDEVTLFLHSVESTLSKDQKEMIRMQHDPDAVLQGRTMLLTDDDLRNTFALSKLLKKHGVNVVIADNGQMALEKLKENPAIELVIMDIMMPIMDGYEAIREIRSQPSYTQLPIIALTALAMPEEQERCMRAGANDYLTKPVDVDRLLTLLRVWLFKQEAA